MAVKKKESKTETTDGLREKFQQIMKIMSKHAIGQKALIECLVLATLSGEHAIFIGPHGCNKTATIDMMAHLLGANKRASLMHNGRKHSEEELKAASFTFFTTLDKYTTPDALFGPYSLRALKDDKWVRNLAGTMAEADLAYVGEIFSANGATLRSMVRALNEREVENGGERIKLRLRSVFADSNFESMENTAAVFDRFLFRLPVTYLERNKKALFQGLMGSEPFDRELTQPVLNIELLDAARAAVQQIEIPSDMVESLYELNNKIIAELKITTLSDRRWRRCLNALRASAWLRGDSAVRPVDFYNALRFIMFDRMQHYSGLLELLEPYRQLAASSNEDEVVAQCKTILDGVRGSDIAHIVQANLEIQKAALLVTGKEASEHINKILEEIETLMLNVEGNVEFEDEDIF